MGDTAVKAEEIVAEEVDTNEVEEHEEEESEKEDLPRIVIEARVRELVEKFSPGMKVSALVMDALNQDINHMIETAVWRCKENGRNTLKFQDF